MREVCKLFSVPLVLAPALSPVSGPADYSVSVAAAVRVVCVYTFF